MRKKKKGTKKASLKGGNNVLRSAMVALAILSFIAFLLFAFLYVGNSKNVARSQNKMTSNILLLNGIGDDYSSLLNGNANAARQLTQKIKNFDNTISEIERGSDEMMLLNSQQVPLIGEIKQQWSVYRRTLDAAISGKHSANDILWVSNQKAKMLLQLNQLKDAYSTAFQHPIGFIPLTYVQWLLLTLIASAIFFAVWVVTILRSSGEVNKEATRLRFVAEERNKNDQEAILRLMDELADLSEGDLTIEAQVTEDFTGAIADSINFTVENMRDMVGTITHTSDEITRATAVSQDVSLSLTESSSEQSRQIEASASTASQMAETLHDIAENTDSSVDIARSSVDIAQEGRNRVQSTIKSMSDIRENIQETAKRIKRLGESSQEIGDIVEIIKGIADQTNVLALNAAIQATAAGEAGRGFAVVADEVQRLAERSANATKRIEVLVKTIQADANEAVASMENSTTQVVTGTDIAEEAGRSLDKIEGVSKNLANLIVNVSKATRNAAGMAGSVSTSMGRLAELNEKAVDDVNTSVKSVEDLRELSSSLKDSVSGFKLPN